MNKENYFKIEVTNETKDLALGIKESMLLQLQDKHKGVAAFNDSKYVFETHDTSEDHIDIANTLSDEIGGANYIVNVDLTAADKVSIAMCSGPANKSNDSTNRNDISCGYIASRFEADIISQVSSEIADASTELPPKVRVDADRFCERSVFEFDKKTFAVQKRFEEIKKEKEQIINSSFINRILHFFGII